jgi:hypothetical protein
MSSPCSPMYTVAPGEITVLVPADTGSTRTSRMRTPATIHLRLFDVTPHHTTGEIPQVTK